MKFDNKIKEILLEYPHIQYSENGVLDFKIEKYRGDYKNFLTWSKHILEKVPDENKELLKSTIIHQGDRIALVLKKSFKEYDFDNDQDILNKFLKDINIDQV